MSTPPTPRHVARLSKYLAEHGPTTATNAELAAQLGVTERSIRYGVSDGEAMGVFTVERRASHAVTDPAGRTIALAGA